MKQEMIGWQWHQLDHMQVICTLLQIDNNACTSSLRPTWVISCIFERTDQN